VSHQVGAGTVHTVGENHINEKPQRASWANTGRTPLGEDCIQISVRLDRRTDALATFVTRFEPPTTACLVMHKPFMKEPVVAGTPNNFQQLQSSAEGATLMWGREKFTITSVVKRSDGAIVEAKMDNQLSLRLRAGCGDSLEKCRAEMPYWIHRKLFLRRL